MIRVPITVTARNEERSIAACLRSLADAQRHAEAVLSIRCEPLVVLDDCHDRTEEIATALGFPCLRSTGGKVEAQRRGSRPGAFQVFCDADVTLRADTLLGLCRTMLEAPEVAIAFPPKRPWPPRRSNPLAWALHVYNRRRGYSDQRTWFSGKLFAIRSWDIPSAAEMRVRARSLPPSRFYALDAPLRVDDIYLSLSTVARAGTGALREISDGELVYRAPETLRGMYRYYRRMRRELERTERLFPELVPALRSHGSRGAERLADAPLADQLAWRIFRLALAGCRAGYVLERAAVDRLGMVPSDPWPSILETKAP